MQGLHGRQPELGDPVEQPLALPEKHRGDVERQLVHDPGRERLTHRRGAARDVDAAVAGDRRGLLERRFEAVGDEVKRRAALHLDRVVGVVGEDEDGGVIRRLVAPPAAPVLVPGAADRAEHVAAHDVGAARTHQPALGGRDPPRPPPRRDARRGPACRRRRAGSRGSGSARRRSRRARWTCGRSSRSWRLRLTPVAELIGATRFSDVPRTPPGRSHPRRAPWRTACTSSASTTCANASQRCSSASARTPRSSPARSRRRRADGIALQLLPGYKSGRPEQPRREGVAESHSRVRSWGTVAAFALIIAVNIGEGIDEGFDFWNWLLIALGAVFILQAVYRLRT